MTNHDEVVRYAQQYTSLGYAVYPVNIAADANGRKFPTFQQPGWGQGQYPTDPDAIAEHWQGFDGIAVNTERSGLVVVDVDESDHKSGSAALAEAGIVLPPTPVVVTTQSGGTHYYYRAGDIPVQSSQSVLAPGVDIRARGGVVFAPPTRVNGGGGYQVGRVTKVADLPVFPKHLAEKLAARPERVRAATVARRELTESGREFHISRREEALAQIKEAGAGTRHSALLRHGPVVFGVAELLGDDPERWVGAVADAYDASGGLDWESEERTARDALAYAVAHPWELPDLAQGPSWLSEDEREQFATEVSRLRVKDAAHDEYNRERAERQAAGLVLATPAHGKDFLATKPTEQQWLIEGLLHRDSIRGYVIGQYKAGKSTLVLNLISSLTTAQPFLGRFAVQEPVKVAYVDLELGESLAHQWLTPMPLDRDRLTYYNMVGLGRQLDMRVDGLRREWARQLMGLGVELLVIDPLSPILSALGIEENSASVRSVLDAFDTLAREAGMRGVIVVDHAGHGEDTKDRARGSSSKMDWLTTRLAVSRAGESFDSERWFRTDGRGTDVFSGRLEMDDRNGTLSIATPEAVQQDSWLYDNRGRELTLTEVAEHLEVSQKTARTRLRAAGWNNTDRKGGRGNPGTWTYPGGDVVTAGDCADPFMYSGY